MDTGFIVILLALFTLLAFVVIAIVSKRKTEARMENDNAEKSTLAADKPSDGKPADV
ncbi:hypothetical protein [Roseobacter sp. CCS2]|uniref:hypothetical protein n=1 Tax=Roseobacter sp. CCS2 TaxID=391593 RepID=UPI0000F3F137|nr:hypothetical protein [Roseobacter sp. CCS2]EBA11168.1 hypothetical protein RCCS2_10365 [Roseobacter sp. CCS2]